MLHPRNLLWLQSFWQISITISLKDESKEAGAQCCTFWWWFIAMHWRNLLWLEIWLIIDKIFWQISIHEKMHIWAQASATCFGLNVDWYTFLTNIHQTQFKTPLLLKGSCWAPLTFTNLRTPKGCILSYKYRKQEKNCGPPKTSTDPLVAACCLWRCRLIQPLSPYRLLFLFFNRFFGEW